MKPFVPGSLPPDTSKWNWPLLITKVSSASASLAYYNGILDSMLNPSIFLSPLETREAILSSKIEGTVTTMDEVLKFEVDMKPENSTKHDDIVEVLNYRKATRRANDWLKRGMPFNTTMICAIQKELMVGVRGKDKKPGELRNELVWIGSKNSKIEQASYVPPEPLSIGRYLDELFEFLRGEQIEVLIQTAILHAQFEIIHPFMDGNGRTGRILIPLFLWHKGRLKSPMFYISEYLEEFRDDYIGNLGLISQKNDWESWINFFLDAIDVQAKRNIEKATQVLHLYNEMKDLIAATVKSHTGIKVLDSLFRMPIFRSSDFIQISGLNHQTTHRILTRLKQERILTTIKKPAGRSPEVFRFNKLYNLIK